MPDNPSATLAAVMQKIEQLADSRDDALKRCDALEKEIAALRLDLQNCRKDLHQARLDAQFLSLSHKLADSPQALAEARHIIGGLIRKVDAAIALVKNDPADI